MFSFLENNKTIQEIRKTNKGSGPVMETLGATGVLLFAELIMNLPIIVIALVVIFAVTIANGGFTSGEIYELPNVYLTIASLIIQLLGCFYIIVWARKRHDFLIRKNLFNKDKYKRKYLKFAGIGFLMMASVTLIGFISKQYAFNGYTAKGQWGLIILMLVGFVFQGAFEEILCRGYLLPLLTRKGSVKMAVIVSSLFFAVLHVLNGNFALIPCINIFLFGIFMALYMLKFNDLWGACAIHSIWNFAQGCIFGFQVSGSELLPSIFMFKNIGHDVLTGGAFGPEGGLITTLILIVSTVILLKIPQKT